MDKENIGEWIADLERRGKSRHTLDAYRRALEHFAWWIRVTYGEAVEPAKVIPRDIRDWLAFQQTVEKAMPTTISLRRVAVGRFFRWAVKRGIARDNPVEESPSIRWDRNGRKPKALLDHDVRKFLRAVHAGGSLRDTAMVEVMLGTGVRVSELLALRVGDVEIKQRSGFLTVHRGKMANFRRIPLTAPVRKVLHAYLETHPESDDPNAPLWLGQRGPLSDRSAVSRMLQKYALKAGIDPFGPHTLRHTFATRYLQANSGDLRGLASLLGHTSLNTVMIYTQPSEDELAKRMEKVENRGAMSA